MPKERSESGQYVETVTLDDVLDVFDTVEGPPVVTSADVAEETGLSRDSARRKLERLRDRGDVAKRKSAGRVLYWPGGYTDAERSRERHEKPSEPEKVDTTDVETQQRETPKARRDDTASVEDAPSPDVTDVVEGVADGWDDTPERMAARKAAARVVLQHALDTGDPIGKSEAVDAYHAEYAVEGQNAETWWRKNIRPVLQAVGEYSRGKHGYVVEDLAGA